MRNLRIPHAKKPWAMVLSHISINDPTEIRKLNMDLIFNFSHRQNGYRILYPETIAKFRVITVCEKSDTRTFI